MIEAARLSVVVTADIKDARSGLDKIDDSVNKLSGSFNSLDEIIKGSLREIGSLAVRGFMHLGSELADTVGIAAGFEQQMSKVKAITQSSTQDMQDLTETAKYLGTVTSFSANEAAEGMEFLGMAGFNTEQIIASLPGTLDLAAAGGLKLGQAADIASNVLTGMGLEASNMTQVADVMAATIIRSNTNIQQLGTAMSYAAPIAGSLGFSIEETSAAIGKLSDAGLQGSVAGTGLRQVLTTLVSPTAKASETMSELGINIFELDGSIKPLPRIIQEFANATRGMTTEQQAATLGSIFQTRALNSMLVLMDESGKNLEEFSAELLNAGGTAQRIAETQLDTLNGSLKILEGAWESLAISMGEIALPVLRQVVDVLVPIARHITAFIEELKASSEPLELFNSRLNELREASTGWAQVLLSGIIALKDALLKLIEASIDVKNYLDTLGLSSDVLKILLISLGVVISATILPAFLSLVGAVNGVLMPLNAVIGVVGALCTIWKTNFLGIQEITQSVFGAINAFVKTATTELVNIFSGVLLIIQGNWDDGWNLITSSVITIFNSFKINIWAKIIEIANGIIQKVQEATPPILNALGAWASSFVNWTETILPQLIIKLSSLVAGIVDWIGQQFLVFASSFASWVSAFVNWAIAVLPQLLIKLGFLIDGVIAWIGQQIDIIARTIAVWVSAFVGWVSEIWPQLLGKLGLLIGGMLDWIGQQIGILVPAIAGWAAVFWEWANEIWPHLVIALMEIQANIISWIVERIPIIAETIAGWAGAFANWVLEKGWPQLYAALETLLPYLVEWVASQVEYLNATFIENWVPAFSSWVQDVWPLIEEFCATLLLDLITWIINTAPKIFETLTTEWAPAFIDWIISDVIPNLNSALHEIWTAILNWIIDTIAKILEQDSVGRYLFDNIIKPIQPETILKKLEEISQGIYGWLGDTCGNITQKDSVGYYLYQNIIAPINLENILAALGEVAQGIFTWITETATNIRNSETVGEIGKAIIEGVRVGIESAWGQLAEWFGTLWEHLIVVAKAALGISSPSSVFASEIGINIVLGVIAGIASGWNLLVGMVGGLFSNIVNSAGNVVRDFYLKGTEMVSALLRGAQSRWDGVKNTLASMFSKVGTNLSGGLTDVARAAGSLVSTLPHIVGKFTTGLDTSALFRAGANVISSITGGMNSKMSAAESTAKATTSGIMSALMSAWDNIAPSVRSSASSIGGDFINGIVAGIQGGTPEITSSVSSMGEKMVSGLQSFLGIHSPSQVAAMQIGVPIVEGIIEGINAASPRVSTALENTVAPVSSNTINNIDNRQFNVNSYPQKSLSEADDLITLLAMS